MPNYDKIKFVPGKKLLNTELHEYQYIERHKIQNLFLALTGSSKGFQELKIDLMDINKVTLAHANVFFWDSLVTVNDMILSNIFSSGVTTNAILYIKVMETIITSVEDSSIINPSIGTPTSERVQYQMSVLTTLNALPEDIVGDIGNNIVYIPIARITGNNTIIPVINYDIYPSSGNKNQVIVSTTAPSNPYLNQKWIKKT